MGILLGLLTALSWGSADLRLKNAKGQTALAIAKRDKVTDVVALLRTGSTHR